MSLQEQINNLFLLDKQVRGLSSRLDAASRRQAASQKKYDQLEQQRQELSQEHTQSKTKAATLEHQTQDIDDKIAQHRQQMNTVHNNKEYSALLLEVNTLKDEKSKLEDEALQYLSSIDELSQKLSEQQEKLDQQQKLLDKSKQEVTEASSEVGEKLDQAKSKLSQASLKIEENSPDSLALFQRLAEEYEGEALAEVEEADRRHLEYNCGGCFIALPIERINTLATRTDQLVTCPNCQRILYMDSELKESLKPQ